MANTTTVRGSTRLPVAILLVLVLTGAAAACSSSSEGSDPTTSPPTLVGTTAAPDDDEGGTTGTTTGTTVPPRTGTSVLDPEEDPPTGDETEQDYVDALLATFDDDPDELFTREDVACIAPIWVTSIGVESFQAAGITPDDIREGSGGIEDLVLDEETAGEVVDAFPSCGLDIMQLFLEGLPSSAREDPATLACITATVTEDQVRAALVDEIRGAAGADPEDLAGDCLT